ncbi:hypothetical protein FHU23_001819 [Clostridium saccharobutylicum]|nr:hypothetical protein CLOSC_29390 [Clostridium saccharobutylicum]OAV40867.1 hypothetical protein M945_1738 [Clostridium saccharobutylicum DSM 13864]AQS01119.1 hypothetical protein CSACC_29460 [Clostridium saccharobutylicum]AQS15102.1 hypothetical protein CLOSACC_29460 [Clostridium saccharobutylicum]MBA2905228.1 hypothetical protein [Clostridium saccharobutylicum]
MTSRLEIKVLDVLEMIWIETGLAIDEYKR